MALARLLIEAPDVLLLDEPTNNLDTDGRQAVAQLLERWQGGILVASHDRALLERVDRIVELTPSASPCSAARGPPLPKRARPHATAPKPTSDARRTPCAIQNARFRKRGRKSRAATRPAAPGAPRASKTRYSWTGRRSVPRTAPRAKAASPIA